MGYNKLVEEHKARTNELKNQLRFVIKSLGDKDSRYLLQAYNSLKERMLMLNGIGVGNDVQKKMSLIKRLTNKGYNMQTMAINAYLDWLKYEREQDRLAAEEAERQRKEKDRILRRVMDVNARLQGQAYRQIKVNCDEEAEKERVLMAKQRGIMRRIVDSNTRLMGMGYNKLLEEHKAKMNEVKDKMKFILRALNEKDLMFLVQAYNGLKERCLMLNGVGLGDSQMKKIQLIKRLTDQGYNMQ